MNKRYKCSYCDKTYASRQGKSRHQKTCINKPINTEEQLVNLNIENNNIEIENLDVHVIDQNNNSESVVKTAIESDDNEDEDMNMDADADTDSNGDNDDDNCVDSEHNNDGKVEIDANDGNEDGIDNAADEDTDLDAESGTNHTLSGVTGRKSRWKVWQGNPKGTRLRRL